MKVFSSFENELVNFISNPIHCDLCSKSFAAKSTLKLHIEIFHESYNRTGVIKINEYFIKVENAIVIDNKECTEFEERKKNSNVQKEKEKKF